MDNVALPYRHDNLGLDCKTSIKVEKRQWHHLTQFEKPTLSVRVEEGVCQIVAVVLGDLEGLVFNTFIQILDNQRKHE